jgi:hypothetical protein
MKFIYKLKSKQGIYACPREYIDVDLEKRLPKSLLHPNWKLGPHTKFGSQTNLI